MMWIELDFLRIKDKRSDAKDETILREWLMIASFKKRALHSKL
jgi:hypothetical protein